MRYPTDKISDIKDSIIDLIKFVISLPKFEIKKVDIFAVASSTITIEIISLMMTTLQGAIQIAGTCDEYPSIKYNNTQSVLASYTFGAGTSGKQTVTFLLIGQ